METEPIRAKWSNSEQRLGTKNLQEWGVMKEEESRNQKSPKAFVNLKDYYIFA